MKNSLFVETGESFVGAKFAPKVINNLYGTNTLAILPREMHFIYLCLRFFRLRTMSVACYIRVLYLPD